MFVGTTASQTPITNPIIKISNGVVVDSAWFNSGGKTWQYTEATDSIEHPRAAGTGLIPSVTSQLPSYALTNGTHVIITAIDKQDIIGKLVAE